MLPAKFHPFLTLQDGWSLLRAQGALPQRMLRCNAWLYFLHTSPIRTVQDIWFKTTFYGMLCNALVSKAPQGHLYSPLGGSVSWEVPASLGR